MSSTVIRIMIHGLIALAPSTNDNDPNHITALLADARVPLECVGEHHPKLSFDVADAPEGNEKECRAAGCALDDGGRCVCTDSLRNKQISLEISPPSMVPDPAANSAVQPVQSQEPDSLANNHGVPPDKSSAGKLVYVANLTKPPFNATLNPEYLVAEPKVTNLFARMKIPFARLTACSLSKREDQGEDYVLPMSLKTLSAKGKVTDRSQAFAQMVLATIENIAREQIVTLHISDFNGGNKKSIILAPGNHGYMIDLSNDPDDLKRGDPCDDGVARHFAYFYEFIKDPPAWKNRLIPHVRFVEGKEAGAADHDDCKDPTFHFMDRPICPMASFIP